MEGGECENSIKLLIAKYSQIAKQILNIGADPTIDLEKHIDKLFLLYDETKKLRQEINEHDVLQNNFHYRGCILKAQTFTLKIIQLLDTFQKTEDKAIRKNIIMDAKDLLILLYKEIDEMRSVFIADISILMKITDSYEIVNDQFRIDFILLLKK